jgi:hypothetical protein
MKEIMGGEDLHNALIALGERLRARTDIVVGGAGALILTGELPRATSDFDVLYSDPDIRRLQQRHPCRSGPIGPYAWMAERQYTDLFGCATPGLQGASNHIAGTGKASHRAAAPARHHGDEAFCRPPT